MIILVRIFPYECCTLPLNSTTLALARISLPIHEKCNKHPNEKKKRIFQWEIKHKKIKKNLKKFKLDIYHRLQQ